MQEIVYALGMDHCNFIKRYLSSKCETILPLVRSIKLMSGLKVVRYVSVIFTNPLITEFTVNGKVENIFPWITDLVIRIKYFYLINKSSFYLRNNLEFLSPDWIKFIRSFNWRIFKSIDCAITNGAHIMLKIL